MEFALEIKENIKNIDIKQVDRIYFGDSFCQNLIPEKQILLETYKLISDNNVKFTLNTPYVTDEVLKKVLVNIETLYKYDNNFEVVFNDWGIFHEIKKTFPNIKLILGRLLTKQRTDPNALKIITNSQEGSNDIVPKKVPKSLYKHFQGSIVNDKIFQEYLNENNIKRVELEYLVWDMKIKLPNDIKATVYYPYAHITTTRNCGILNMTYAKCNKMCRDVKIEYPSNLQHPFSYIVMGNTVYYSIENIMTNQNFAELYRNAIDQEQETNELLHGFDHNYPGVLKTANVDEIISLLRGKKNHEGKDQNT